MLQMNKNEWGSESSKLLSDLRIWGQSDEVMSEHDSDETTQPAAVTWLRGSEGKMIGSRDLNTSLWLG